MLHHLPNSRLCLFFDGLDEYRMIDREGQYKEEQLDLMHDGSDDDEAWSESSWILNGYRQIAKLLCKFTSYRNVKVCMSSRELGVFENAFKGFPRLHVHEHTADSIAKYCQNRLAEDASDLTDRSEFVCLITQASRGVFLWVSIVVQLIIDGNTDGDSKEELMKTLKCLPRKLRGKDGLYMHMMQIVKPSYLPEAKRLFQLVMGWSKVDSEGPLDIITLFLAEPGHLEAENGKRLLVQDDDFCPKSWAESRPRWEKLQRRLKSRCGGLLEGTDEVQFMHQTAKEFMSRPNIWESIFRNSAGFDSDLDTNFALLSGLIRRMKCCGEAAFEPEYIRTLWDSNGHSTFNDTTTDLFTRVEIPKRSFELLSSALSIAYFLSSSSGHFGDDYVSLLDELDTVSNQLTENLRVSLSDTTGVPSVADMSWLKTYFEPLQKLYGETPNGATINNMLELATVRDSIPYIEAKVRGKGVPLSQLQLLLPLATRTVRLPFRFDRGTSLLGYPCPEAAELFLEEGADPNCRDLTLPDDMLSEESCTAWTGLLRDLLECSLDIDSQLRAFIATAKVLLKYGADPTVQFQRRVKGKNDMAMESVTPEIIIKMAMAKWPGYQKDFAKILELLNQAKANWNGGAASREQEEGP
ncbi:uncharacterized protein PV07_01880 [Cladophialophora immunda]|uniref:DUF7791 domain-containing protein n=1 Tax=Cladophialophora immunda TaxID=569365 RepID=A0A0D2A4C8_9EURO|nr:uncharacterized protein PV07_01880 [Cladophialophora immunda]KIW35166.1 hypothetical protein PV07_01880 [Cladophialophora immunda]